MNFAVLMDSVEAYSLYSAFLSKESLCSIKVPRKLSLASMEQALKKATAVGSSKLHNFIAEGLRNFFRGYDD